MENIRNDIGKCTVNTLFNDISSNVLGYGHNSAIFGIGLTSIQWRNYTHRNLVRSITEKINNKIPTL